jgi:hypothetical protein
MDMPTPDDEFYEYLLQAGKRSIEERDVFPTLVTDSPDGIQVFVLAGDAHPYERLITVLPIVADSKPTRVAFTSDSYYFHSQGDDAEAQADRIRAAYDNSLARAFEAGEPLVHEALVINIVTVTSTSVRILPYVRHENAIEWLEPVEEKAGYSGRMIEAMRRVFA